MISVSKISATSDISNILFTPCYYSGKRLHRRKVRGSSIKSFMVQQPMEEFIGNNIN
jgi:hypothetical protein